MNINHFNNNSNLILNNNIPKDIRFCPVPTDDIKKNGLKNGLKNDFKNIDKFYDPNSLFNEPLFQNISENNDLLEKRANSISNDNQLNFYINQDDIFKYKNNYYIQNNNNNLTDNKNQCRNNTINYNINSNFNQGMFLNNNFFSFFNNINNNNNIQDSNEVIVQNYNLPQNYVCEKKLFFSHTWRPDSLGRNNHDRVYQIVKLLQKMGWTTWFDEEDMTHNIDASMADGIENSEAIIICLTQTYFKKVNETARNPRGRDNCLKEWNYATSRDKLIIPVIMEKELKNINNWNNGVITMYLGNTIFIDCSDNDLEIGANNIDKRLKKEKIFPYIFNNNNSLLDMDNRTNYISQNNTYKSQKKINSKCLHKSNSEDTISKYNNNLECKLEDFTDDTINVNKTLPLKFNSSKNKEIMSKSYNENNMNNEIEKNKINKSRLSTKLNNDRITSFYFNLLRKRISSLKKNNNYNVVNVNFIKYAKENIMNNKIRFERSNSCPILN